MFEPVSQNLYEMSMFAILGFALAALYELLRTHRLLFKPKPVTVGVQDFLFLAISGVIVFAYSLEFGIGYFRYFYLIALVFGATVYFLTLGKLINMVMGRFAGAIRTFISKVAQVLTVKLCNINKVVKKRRKALQLRGYMVYNKKKSEIQEKLQARLREKQKASEKRNGEQEITRPESPRDTGVRARVRKV